MYQDFIQDFNWGGGGGGEHGDSRMIVARKSLLGGLGTCSQENFLSDCFWDKIVV